MLRHLTGLILVLLTAACAANDPQPVTPQRPTFSSDTNTTAEGTLELESGLDVDPNEFDAVVMTLKYGLARNAEVFMTALPFVRLDEGPDGDPQQGLGDVFLGWRHRVWQNESGLSTAYQISTKLPTAHEALGLGSGEVDFLGAAIVMKAIGAASVTGFYEVGVLGTENGDDTDLRHLVTFAGSTPIAGRFGYYGELAGFYGANRSDLGFLTTGATYTVAPSMVVDFGFRFGLTAESPDAALIVGVTTNFGRPGGARSAPLP